MMAGQATRQMAILRLLEGGGCLTTAKLAEQTGYPGKGIADACCRLILRGWLDRLERGCFTLSCEGRRALAAGETITSGPTAPLNQHARRPKRRTRQDKMWSAIRASKSKKFDLARLEEMAGASYAGARRFVTALVRAGYASELRRQPGEALTSNGFKRWVLVDDPGPQTPVVKADGRVWDPNRDEYRDMGVRP